MDEKKITKITGTILNQLDNISIEKVVLFGSATNNRFSPKSDIDLIILSKSFREKTLFEKAKMFGDLEWLLINEIDKPFDILYYSDEEWENSSSLMIQEAKKHGKIIYGN